MYFNILYDFQIYVAISEMVSEGRTLCEAPNRMREMNNHKNVFTVKTRQLISPEGSDLVLTKCCNMMKNMYANKNKVSVENVKILTVNQSYTAHQISQDLHQ